MVLYAINNNIMWMLLYWLYLIDVVGMVQGITYFIHFNLQLSARKCII